MRKTPNNMILYLSQTAEMLQALMVLLPKQCQLVIMLRAISEIVIMKAAAVKMRLKLWWQKILKTNRMRMACKMKSMIFMLNFKRGIIRGLKFLLQYKIKYSLQIKRIFKKSQRMKILMTLHLMLLQANDLIRDLKMKVT